MTRNAALMVYRPNGGRGPRKVRLYTDADITGPAPWAPVIPEAAWRAVRDILTDPARTVGPGNTPRWLGSRLYRCGICDDGSTLVVSGSTSNGRRYFRYFCREKGHLARAAVPCDEYVGAVVTAWLAGPGGPRGGARAHPGAGRPHPPHPRGGAGGPPGGGGGGGPPARAGSTTPPTRWSCGGKRRRCGSGWTSRPGCTRRA